MEPKKLRGKMLKHLKKEFKNKDFNISSFLTTGTSNISKEEINQAFMYLINNKLITGFSCNNSVVNIILPESKELTEKGERELLKFEKNQQIQTEIDILENLDAFKNTQLNVEKDFDLKNLEITSPELTSFLKEFKENGYIQNLLFLRLMGTSVPSIKENMPPYLTSDGKKYLLELRKKILYGDDDASNKVTQNITNNNYSKRADIIADGSNFTGASIISNSPNATVNIDNSFKELESMKSAFSIDDQKTIDEFINALKEFKTTKKNDKKLLETFGNIVKFGDIAVKGFSILASIIALV